MIFLQAVLIITAVLIAAFRLSTLAVYGRAISDKILVPFLEKNLKNYRTSIISDGKILHGDISLDLPYISTVYFDPLVKYHVRSIGTIPRWSKAHKIIETEFSRQAIDKYEVLKK